MGVFVATKGGGRSRRRRRCEPATRPPFEGVRAPSLRVRVEGLHVDVDGRMRGDYVRLVSQSDGLGVEACGLWEEDYGSVQAKSLILSICVSEGLHGVGLS